LLEDTKPKTHDMLG